MKNTGTINIDENRLIEDNPTEEKPTQMDIICESCDPWAQDPCCVGVLHDCKIIIKPMVYDHMAPIIIIVPLEHKPIWELNTASIMNLHLAMKDVCNILIQRGQFPNLFTGGNINNAKYGLQGVHAHIHIEPRVKEDPAYNTFPQHTNKRMLSNDEIDVLKQEWKLLLKL